MQGIPVSLLHAFVVFNRSRNIDEAAARLGITQPALSKQLKALEAQLPERVFTQMGRKKVLTPIGRELDERIGERLAGIGEIIRQTFTAHAEPAAAKVRIAARRGVLDRLCEQLEFSGALDLQEAANEKVIDEVLSRKVDLGIAHAVPESSEIVAKPLFKEEFVLVVPKKFHERAQPSKKMIESLVKIPCLVYKRPDEVLHAFVAGFGVDTRSLDIKRVTENYSALLAMAEAGLGWTLLPSYFEVSECWTCPVPSRLLPPRRFHLLARKETLSARWFRELEAGLRACF